MAERELEAENVVRLLASHGRSRPRLTASCTSLASLGWACRSAETSQARGGCSSGAARARRLRACFPDSHRTIDACMPAEASVKAFTSRLRVARSAAAVAWKAASHSAGGSMLVLGSAPAAAALQRRCRRATQHAPAAPYRCAVQPPWRAHTAALARHAALDRAAVRCRRRTRAARCVGSDGFAAEPFQPNKRCAQARAGCEHADAPLTRVRWRVAPWLVAGQPAENRVAAARVSRRALPRTVRRPAQAPHRCHGACARLGAAQSLRRLALRRLREAVLAFSPRQCEPP
jgi:hypothetical protein